MIEQHLAVLGEYLDLYSSDYEKILILGDFSVSVKENHMKCFCDNYGLKTLIRKPTWYKSFENPTCIDLMLTNVPRSFLRTCVIETALSDFHLITLTVMRKEYRKFQSRIFSYRSYRHFSNEKFSENLLHSLSKVSLVNDLDGF